MPTLFVLRHAKASWDEPALTDHDRPLARRGIRACAALRRHCRETRVDPELALCSTAVRARDTLGRVLPELDNVRFEPELYLASGRAIADRVRQLDGVSAIVVGHNPGLQDAILLLSRPSPLREQVAEKLPTGALATIELDSWDDPDGELVALALPREL
ncbi:MAG: histidine phosphatase family protein [Gaiellales bacterium]